MRIINHRLVHFTSLVLPSILFPIIAAAAIDARAEPQGWPRDQVLIPTKLFAGKDKLDKIILESNPRLYLYPDFDPKAEPILVVGMDGWGGRSENFIDTMRLGFKAPGLTKRLVVAALQDPKTRGPRYQGQGDREHANVWSLEEDSIPVMRRFVTKITDDLGAHFRVYFMGYSTGSVAAPLCGVRVAEMGPSSQFTIEGAIALGTGSGVSASRLKALNQRVLFIVVPKQGPKEHKSHRYDQGNRSNAIAAQERLAKGGAVSYLRFIESAKRHFDWHWGLMSQCRYFRTLARTDDGRGYWPHYWLPNPDSWGLMAIFIQGKEPPERLSNPPTKCPLPPNAFNPEDPG